MLLGLLADIHEAVEPLREALERFRQLGVDEVVHLGDITMMLRRLDETCRILSQSCVEGVWGNHDFGLCGTVADETRDKFSKDVLDYMSRLQPHLIRGDCRFSHVEPWLDAHDIQQLWYFEGLPTTPEKLVKNFAAVPQRVLFSGHMHSWFLATEEGVCEWQGEEPIRLAPPTRYLLILHAVIHGHCATYDTTTHLFTPIRLSRVDNSDL